MTTKSRHPYPPDFVSAETLAHKLDCSESTVHDYVRRGLLPKPIKIGQLVRWRWVDVEQFIAALEAGPSADDPYLLGIDNVTKAHH